jgi:hypothetical protein
MHYIRTPEDVRGAILAALAQRGYSRYGFSRAIVNARLMQAHTVDCVLSDPDCNTHRVPTLATAIELLNAAGYDLIAKPRDSGLTISTPRRNAR